MPADAIDLIDKLLVLNPIERLGYGPPDHNMDFTGLKNHKFFDGLDFD